MQGKRSAGERHITGGFTHISGKSHKGGFAVLRQTIRSRMRTKLHEIKEALRQRMHPPIPETGLGSGR
jgi:hypothetical protein